MADKPNIQFRGHLFLNVPFNPETDILFLFFSKIKKRNIDPNDP